MGKTYKHKLQAKYKANLLPNGKDVTNLTNYELSRLYPRFMLKFWNRINFEVGFFRYLKIKKKYSLKNDIDFQMNKK